MFRQFYLLSASRTSKNQHIYIDISVLIYTHFLLIIKKFILTIIEFFSAKFKEAKGEKEILWIDFRLCRLIDRRIELNE